MRLTEALFGVFKRRGFGGPRFHFVKHIPGKITIGKHRIVPEVTPKFKMDLWKKLAIEEKTMMYLSQPYLTTEEEKYVPKEFVRRGLRTYREVSKPKRRPLKSLFAADLLSHINVDRQWEE
ncbi:large ribosomal subunit protein mL63 [Amblyomma americanum]|uniref:Ribosomal protein 63 mitochondrial n=1 Tax=Amblyomma americanum TaxID=6943 RepID=A0AAQ4D8U1_AMBAM